VAQTAFDPKMDSDLVALSADKIFPERITKVAHRKRAYLRGYARDLMAELSTDAAEHFKDMRG
jgi:hypothetical protein